MNQKRKRDYYVTARGIKVLCAEEEIDPDYLKELCAEAMAIRHGKKRMISATEIKNRLCKSGVNI